MRNIEKYGIFVAAIILIVASVSGFLNMNAGDQPCFVNEPGSCTVGQAVNAPEFPSAIPPIGMIIVFLGAVRIIRKNQEY